MYSPSIKLNMPFLPLAVPVPLRERVPKLDGLGAIGAGGGGGIIISGSSWSVGDSINWYSSVSVLARDGRGGGGPTLTVEALGGGRGLLSELRTR